MVAGLGGAPVPGGCSAYNRAVDSNEPIVGQLRTNLSVGFEGGAAGGQEAHSDDHHRSHEGRHASRLHQAETAAEYPGRRVELKRATAEEDLVLLHCHQDLLNDPDYFFYSWVPEQG